MLKKWILVILPAVVALTLVAGTSFATVRCVPNTAVGPSCVTGHATIQDAIDSAVDGDTVRVGVGVFNPWSPGRPMVYVDKSLQLLGARAGFAVDLRDGSDESEIQSHFVLDVGASGTLIEGFTFSETPGNPSGGMTAGVVVEQYAGNSATSGTVIRANRFMGGAGVLLIEGEDLTIESNLFSGFVGGGRPKIRLGLWVGQKMGGFWILDNSFENANGGIRFYRAHFDLSASGRQNRIEGNSFQNIPGVVVKEGELKGVTISGNNFSSSGLAGIVKDAMITRNCFANVTLTDPEGVQLSYNNFAGGLAVCSTSATATVLFAENNYWGLRAFLDRRRGRHPLLAPPASIPVLWFRASNGRRRSGQKAEPRHATDNDYRRA
jgi:hypothetical protein